MVSQTSTSLARPSGLVTPAAGSFSDVSAQLADKGFLVTTTDDLINWARTGSLMWMTFGLACCAVEMMQASMPRWDLERFGFAPRASPRQSDVMIVAGRYATRWRPRCARSTTRCPSRATSFRWEAAPTAAATTTTPTRGARLRPHRARRCLCAGCPPTAEALVYGVLLLQRKIRRTGTIER
jgi:NADH-quinone oxidoreductase subunit B